jgi:hypothetical protein
MIPMSKSIVKNVFCIFILYLFAFQSLSQENKYINPDDPEFRAKYNHLIFNDKFVLLAETDQTNNYFIADFSKLTSKFEKVYFLNLVFGSDKIVNIDGDLSHDRIWFLANHKYSEMEIIANFNDLKDKTLKAKIELTENEQKSWLLKNDKVK